MISTVILTRDEESDLPVCLGSLIWCDDIHVVDSGSKDRTVAIANSARAHVYLNEFKSFGKQRNWSLENCLFKYNWILFLDADEQSTPAFHQAIIAAVTSASDGVAGFYCCWKMILDGRWLKRCDSFPKWQFRLLKLGRARFTDFGHGQKEYQVQGTVDYIREPYLHFAFSKGWFYWLERHNRYSSLEAAERVQTPVKWSQIFSWHGAIRNKALKPLVSRIPGWPLLIFCLRYFLKGGFLEGRSGLIFCVNMSYYEFLIRLKMDELQSHRKMSGATPTTLES